MLIIRRINSINTTYARCRIDKIDSPDDEHMVCSEHVEYRYKHIWKKIVLQVGYVQELYGDVRLTEREIFQAN